VGIRRRYPQNRAGVAHADLETSSKLPDCSSKLLLDYQCTSLKSVALRPGLGDGARQVVRQDEFFDDRDVSRVLCGTMDSVLHTAAQFRQRATVQRSAAEAIQDRGPVPSIRASDLRNYYLFQCVVASSRLDADEILEARAGHVTIGY